MPSLRRLGPTPLLSLSVSLCLSLSLCLCLSLSLSLSVSLSLYTYLERERSGCTPAPSISTMRSPLRTLALVAAGAPGSRLSTVQSRNCMCIGYVYVDEYTHRHRHTGTQTHPPTQTVQSRTMMPTVALDARDSKFLSTTLTRRVTSPRRPHAVLAGFSSLYVDTM